MVLLLASVMEKASQFGGALLCIGAGRGESGSEAGPHLVPFDTVEVVGVKIIAAD